MLEYFSTTLIDRMFLLQTFITNGLAQPPPVLAPSDGSLLYYTPFEYPHTAIAPALEYNLIDPTSILGK